MFSDMELEKDCQNARKINEENLKKLLSDNAQTVFGQKYGFSSIENANQYRKKVPLLTYDEFGADVEAMVAGQKNLLTVYPIANYVKTSGTEGTQKYIPISYLALQRYSDYIERYKTAVMHQHPGKRLFVNSFRTDLKKDIRQMQILSETYYRYLAEHHQMKKEEYVGGWELLFCEEEGERLYAKVWMGFLEENIVLIESIFLYDQLLFFQYMEHHWQEVLQEIRAGFIPKGRKIPSKIQNYLLSLPVDRDRLDCIEQQCLKGFDNIARRLWPELYMVSGISNRSFFAEDHALRRYLGEIPIHFFSYVASECHLGVALEPENYYFVMLPRSAFYEYLPYEEESSQPEGEKTLLPHELEPGKLYEVVITNFCGFYRYRLGDVVRMIDFYYESPRVEFMFRKNQVLNIAGEKMETRQVERAVGALNQMLSGRISEYCISTKENRIPGSYAAVFSGRQLTAAEDAAHLSELLDWQLKERNVDYEDLRNLKYIEKPEVLLLSHNDYTEFMNENGYGQGHRKPHHIVSGGFSEKEWNKWRGRE